MRATVTVTEDDNLRALEYMLGSNGLYLVRVHNKKVVDVAPVPRGRPVCDLDGGVSQDEKGDGAQ